MKLAILMSLAVLSSCSAEGGAGASVQQRTATPELGASTVVLPASSGSQVRWLGHPEGTAYWDPTHEQVARIASLLRPALEKGLAEPLLLDPTARDMPDRQAWIQTEVGLILGQLDDYRRQYVGIISHEGRIQILVRCFPGPDMDPGFPFESWREEIVVVSDGGADYWYAVFDVEHGVLVHLDSNGYA